MDGVGSLSRPHWLTGSSVLETAAGERIALTQPAFIGYRASDAEGVEIGTLSERRGRVLAADGSWRGTDVVLHPIDRSMETFRLDVSTGDVAMLRAPIRWTPEAGAATAGVADGALLLFALWAAKLLHVKWAGLSQGGEYRILEPQSLPS